MLQKSNTSIVTTPPPSESPSSLTESIARYVLASEPIKQFAEGISMVQQEWTPAGKLDILETESNECRKLAVATTRTERCLNYIGARSERQTALLARAAALDNERADIEVKKEELKLRAAVIVESLYQSLFEFNPSLRTALGLMKAAIATAETRTTHVGGERDWQSTWFDRGANAFFELNGVNLGADSRHSYELSSLIRSGQRLILDYNLPGEAVTIFKTMGDMLAPSSALQCLSDAAIVSVDGQVSSSCGTNAEMVQEAARDIIDKVEHLRSAASLGWDWDTLIDNIYGTPSRFVGRAKSTIRQINNTENEVRWCITRAIFPTIGGLSLLRDLYPADRAQELVKARDFLRQR